jgi:hypothetical protein
MHSEVSETACVNISGKRDHALVEGGIAAGHGGENEQGIFLERDLNTVFQPFVKRRIGTGDHRLKNNTVMVAGNGIRRDHFNRNLTDGTDSREQKKKN